MGVSTRWRWAARCDRPCGSSKGTLKSTRSAYTRDDDERIEPGGREASKQFPSIELEPDESDERGDECRRHGETA
jgi:hypothetical protein